MLACSKYVYEVVKGVVQFQVQENEYTVGSKKNVLVFRQDIFGQASFSANLY